MSKKKSKIKVSTPSKNYKSADFIDMEESIRDAEGEGRVVMFKGLLLELFLIVARDNQSNTNKFLAKIAKSNKMWRHLCSKYPISESAYEMDLGTVYGIEQDVVNADLYCAMLVAIKVEQSVIVKSNMGGVSSFDDMSTAVEWLQEVTGERFNRDDILEELCEI